MTDAIQFSPTSGARSGSMRAAYRNPSVHEVVLDVLLSHEVPEASLAMVPQLLGEGFGPAQRLEQQSLEVHTGSGVESKVHAQSSFAGWRFEITPPRLVLVCARNRLTMHMVRSQGWPSGEYVGWEAIFERFGAVLNRIAPIYSGATLRRVGLRYVNRLAIPASAEMDQWLEIGVTAPKVLKRPWSFHLQQTWAEIEGYKHLSATINLAKVKVEDESLAKSHTGLVFDIDIFNLSPAHVPQFSNLVPWYHEAHAAENAVFESCITESLRAAFNRT